MRRSLPCVLVLLCASIHSIRTRAAEELQWRPLPNLPDREGFAGAFAGVASGSLVFAGGANFPGKPPWEGGKKVWYTEVYALDRPAGQWRRSGSLPGPRGYGVSVTTDAGLLCIGGSDDRQHYADCFQLEIEEGKLTQTPFPSLPMACANLSGARLGNVVYVAGGMATPTSTSTLHQMWSLDLRNVAAGWKVETPWPGPARMLAVAAVQDGSFFLVSGTDLSLGADGQGVRTYLTDAYRFRPQVGWERIADLPRAAVAAPSPALTLGKSQFLVLGGDDGRLVDFEPKDQHPGFSKDILAYHTITNTWTVAGTTPFPVVTAPAVFWSGHGHVIVSGEIRPGKRTPQVWQGITVRD